MIEGAPTTEAPAAPAAEPVVTAPAVPAAPAAPAPVAAPVVPAAPAEPTGPLDRTAALRQMQEQRAKATEEAVAPPVTDVVLAPVVDEHGRKHDPRTGEYLPGEAEKPSTQVAVAPPAPTTPTAIKVPVKDGHFLREMGITELDAADEKQAEGIRAALNAETRRKDVERLTARNAELEALLLRQEARETAQAKWQQSPEYTAAVERYHKTKDLEDAGELPAGTADRVWKAETSELQRLEQEEVTVRETALVEAEQSRYAEEFTNEAWARVSGIEPAVRGLPEFQAWFDQAIEDFDSQAIRGRFKPILDVLETPEERAAKLHELFREQFAQTLMGKNEVMEVFRNQQAAVQQRTTSDAAAAERLRQERAAADTAAVERYKQELADKRRQAPLNPLAQPAAAARPGVTVAPGSGDVDVSTLSPLAAKEHFKEQARQRMRALTQTPP